MVPLQGGNQGQHSSGYPLCVLQTKNSNPFLPNASEKQEICLVPVASKLAFLRLCPCIGKIAAVKVYGYCRVRFISVCAV